MAKGLGLHSLCPLPSALCKKQPLQKSTTPSYWSLIWRRFKQNRGARWSFRVFTVLLWIAILNPFLVGDVPIYTKTDGESHFPIFKKYLIDLGLAQKTGPYLSSTYWHEQQFDQAIYPIIPYSSGHMDTKNVHYKSPFGPQNGDGAWHWFGTDKLGRDVAAGIIEGFQVALKVGLFSMFIATIIGLFMGGLAGYFGDDKLRVSVLTLLLNILAFFAAIHFAFISRSYQLYSTEASGEFLKSIAIFMGIFILANLIAKGVQKLTNTSKTITIPLDLLVMRLIEVLNSVPKLLLIIAFAAIFNSQTLWPIILIIGFFGWTGVARFFRAELLRVRNMPYIQAAKAMGFSNWRILLKHALPNAVGPVMILVAFGIASAIIVEASLSFLGIGLDGSTQVTWGTILKNARGSEANWWMAIFPGLAIFLTVLIFNLIGEGLKQAIDAKDI